MEADLEGVRFSQTPWGNSDLKDGPILLKIFLGQIVKRGAKTVQCP
jgi:hypothetical protein